MILVIFISMMLIDSSVAINFNMLQCMSKPKKAKTVIEEIIASGSFCVEKDNFDFVKHDQSAVYLMIAEICTRVPRKDAKNYLEENYGRPKELLGKGSFGKVYRYNKLIQDGETKNTAIKVPKDFKYKDLFVELNSSECMKEKLDKSAQKYYGLIKECIWPIDRNPHMIMEYYKYTFQQKIDKFYIKRYEKSSSDKQRMILSDMLMITNELKALHDFGIAHRDLKPQNIMIDEEKTPILVDFGLTTPNGKLSKTICGTPFYADYEMFTKTSTGITTDIYALGIIFAQMYLGRKADETIDEMIKKGAQNAGQFEPDFKDLGAPEDFLWTENMFKQSKGMSTILHGERWTAEKVSEKLTEMIKNINSTPEYIV